MNHLLLTILHVTYVTGVYLIIFGTLTLIQMHTVGLLFNLNDITVRGVPITIMIFIAISFVLINQFVEITSVWK